MNVPDAPQQFGTEMFVRVAQWQAVRAERDALQEELAAKDDENDALKVERDAAIFEAARLRHEDLAEKSREVESLRIQLTETRSERDDLAINYSKANARVESLRTALAELVRLADPQVVARWQSRREASFAVRRSEA